jgi:hypothetical protein
LSVGVPDISNTSSVEVACTTGSGPEGVSFEAADTGSGVERDGEVPQAGIPISKINIDIKRVFFMCSLQRLPTRFYRNLSWFMIW